jgi:hypothetical protein
MARFSGMGFDSSVILLPLATPAVWQPLTLRSHSFTAFLHCAGKKGNYLQTPAWSHWSENPDMVHPQNIPE